jgi:riboflavin synthase
MFSGIVEERAVVLAAASNRIVIGCRQVLGDSEVDSSVSVNGVCLTVVERGEDTLAFDVTPETLSRSTLGRLRPGDAVNLERPVTLLTRLGGHLVQGHVDGLGEIVSLEPNEAGATVVVRPPAGLMRYIAEKGSVAVDGISLTVAGVSDGTFTVALIPHTLEMTTLGSTRVGDAVNLEADVMAKYVERLLEGTEG